VIAGTDPEILGTYANGKAKYKKRTSATDSFNFDPTLHTTQTHKKQVSAHFAKIIGKHSTSYLASLRPSSLTKKKKSNPNQNTPKQVMAPRQPKKSSPKKKHPKKRQHHDKQKRVAQQEKHRQERQPKTQQQQQRPCRLHNCWQQLPTRVMSQVLHNNSQKVLEMQQH